MPILPGRVRAKRGQAPIHMSYFEVLMFKRYMTPPNLQRCKPREAGVFACPDQHPKSTPGRGMDSNRPSNTAVTHSEWPYYRLKRKQIGSVWRMSKTEAMDGQCQRIAFLKGCDDSQLPFLLGLIEPWRACWG